MVLPSHPRPHPHNGNAFDLLKAAYRWLAFPNQWSACLGWNLGIAGLLAMDHALRRDELR